MPPAVRAKKRDNYFRDSRRRKVCAFCADKTTQTFTIRLGMLPHDAAAPAGETPNPSVRVHRR